MLAKRNRSSAKKWGIIIPAFVIVALAVLASLDLGLTVESRIAKTIDGNKLIHQSTEDKSCQNYPHGVHNPEDLALVQTFIIKNDFFVPRVVELPTYMTCYQPLKDSWDYNYQDDIIVYKDGKELYPYYESFNFRQRNAVEIPPYSEQVVELRLRPECVQAPLKIEEVENTTPEQEAFLNLFRGMTNKTVIPEYQEVIFVEADEDYYYINCNQLTTKEMARSVTLPIVY